MERLLQSLFHFGSLVRSSPPTLSPSLDDFELLQFLRPAPAEEPSQDFRVLLNVALLEPDEVRVEVVGSKTLEIQATHGRRSNVDGLWITRDLKYTYEIPQEVQGKTLHSEWSEDGYLLVQAKPLKDEKAEEVDRIRLVPERVPYTVRPAVEIGVVRNLIEDIRDKAICALRYIRSHARGGTTSAEKQAEEILAEKLALAKGVETRGEETLVEPHKTSVEETEEKESEPSSRDEPNETSQDVSDPPVQ